MAIIHYDNNIAKDTNVFGDNVYYDNGQGCGTVWFSSVTYAKKAMEKNGLISGRHLANCNMCQTKTNDEKHKPRLCHDAKREYVLQFQPVVTD